MIRETNEVETRKGISSDACLYLPNQVKVTEGTGGGASSYTWSVHKGLGRHTRN